MRSIKWIINNVTAFFDLSISTYKFVAIIHAIPQELLSMICHRAIPFIKAILNVFTSIRIERGSGQMIWSVSHIIAI